MFNLKTLPEVFIEEDQINSFKISKINNNTYVLSDGHKQLMTYGLWHNIQAKEFYSSYDLAYGDVRMSGLGFGVLPLWIANKPGVNSVTVYESSQEVIHMFLKTNICPQNMTIVWSDINDVIDDQPFDCLFLDHYELEDTVKKISNMKSIIKNIPNHTVFWSWSLESEYAKLMYRRNSRDMVDFELVKNLIDFSTEWDNFRKHVVEIETLPKLSRRKINEYVYTYFDRLGYTIP